MWGLRQSQSSNGTSGVHPLQGQGLILKRRELPQYKKCSVSQSCKESMRVDFSSVCKRTSSVVISTSSYDSKTVPPLRELHRPDRLFSSSHLTVGPGPLRRTAIFAAHPSDPKAASASIRIRRQGTSRTLADTPDRGIRTPPLPRRIPGDPADSTRPGLAPPLLPRGLQPHQRVTSFR